MKLGRLFRGYVAILTAWLDDFRATQAGTRDVCCLGGWGRFFKRRRAGWLAFRRRRSAVATAALSGVRSQPRETRWPGRLGRTV